MAANELGFQSEALSAALADALAGRPAELERLFCRMGAVVTARPNLKLAAAFGAEMAARKGAAAPLLSRLGGDDAAPDTDRAFLPIAAAFGWAGRIRAGKEVEEAWAALFELAADERAPVRVGTLDVLITLGLRDADALVARAASWLEADDRELRYGAAALVIEALGDRRVLANVGRHEELLDYLSRVLAEVADAPRSASRSEGRARLLAALPRALAGVVADFSAGEHGEGQRWLAAACEDAKDTDLRAVLSDAIVALRAPAFGQSSAVAQSLRSTLEASAKPLRDPSRVRPGLGRGKASRRTR
jgi:hypothetical protein